MFFPVLDVVVVHMHTARVYLTLRNKIQAIGKVLEPLDPAFDSPHEPVGVTPVDIHVVPVLDVFVVHVVPRQNILDLGK